MRNTLLATVAIAIGLVACADRTPTGVVDIESPTLDVAPSPPVFQDGFESGTLANWDDGVNTSLHRILTDATLAHSGSRLLEVTYPSTGNGSWLTKFILPGYESVHISYWVRFPATWRGGTHLLGVYGSSLTNQWSAHGKAGVCPTGTNFFSSFAFLGAGDPGPLRFSTYHPAMPRSGTQCWGDQGASGVYQGSGLLSRDAWHKVELFVQANTPGQANGVQRMWVDGALRAEWTGLRFRDTPNLVISSIQLVLHSETAIAQTQRMYIDDVVVSQTRPPNAIASVDVAPSAASLAVGASTQLAATARDAAGSPVGGTTFAWSSSNPAIASVSPTGLVTAHASGTADVTATAGGITGRSTVTVSGATPVASVSVVPGSGSVAAGQSLQFVATPRDAAGNPLTGRAITWTSSSPAVATVDGTGRATGVSAGTTVLRATSEGQSGTASLTVTGGSTSPAPVATVAISPAVTSVAPGATVQFSATLRDAAGNILTGRSLFWYSNHPLYASIDANGRATAHYPGTAHIVVVSEGVNATASLTVADAALPPPPPPPPPPPGPVASITLTPALATAQVGSSVQFTATLRDAAGNLLTGQSVFWYSNHPLYASVDANGRATALNPGTAHIVVVADGVNATGSLTVTGAAPPPPPPVVVTRMDVTPASVTLATGATRQFAATEFLSDGSSRAATGVTWTATGGTISAGGLYLAGSSGGSYRVIGTKGAFADTGAVTITASPPPVVVTQIVLTPASATLATGATQQFTATAQMSNGTQQPATVTYTATGGTISGAGLYTAGSSGGSYRVIATQQGGILADTSAITLTAPPPPPPPCSGTCSLDWFEDFRSGTLSARGLVREASNASVVIVSASGLGFPSGTVNVARNIHAGALDVQWVANNLWRNPAVGEFVFLRMYIRNSLPNGANTGADHGMQCNVGDVKWAWLIPSGSSGTYYMDVANSAQSNIRLASGIPKSSVQRLELRLSRTSSTSGVATFRIYSSTGTLLGEGTRNMSGMTDALYRTARWGLSGQAGASYVGNGIEWGNLAARVSANSNDWIGAYPVAGVEQ